MSDGWVSENEALAIITIRTGLADPADLLRDAVEIGRVSVDQDKPTPEHTDAIRSDLNLFAGGFSAIDAEYDPLFSSSRLYRRAELEAWINDLVSAGVAGRADPKKLGRRPKQPAAIAAYREIYGPEGHGRTGDTLARVVDKVGKRIGMTIDPKTMTAALDDERRKKQK